eukprot:GHVT01102822.1.p1 GENE.GHVT01102822.1~~GHVT01102822.1.p1  ORF type:complete len:553 (+),score=68.36 GHVT01102822.1:537-2195(+)
MWRVGYGGSGPCQCDVPRALSLLQMPRSRWRNRRVIDRLFSLLFILMVFVLFLMASSDRPKHGCGRLWPAVPETVVWPAATLVTLVGAKPLGKLHLPGRHKPQQQSKLSPGGSVSIPDRDKSLSELQMIRYDDELLDPAEFPLSEGLLDDEIEESSMLDDDKLLDGNLSGAVLTSMGFVGMSTNLPQLAIFARSCKDPQRNNVGEKAESGEGFGNSKQSEQLTVHSDIDLPEIDEEEEEMAMNIVRVKHLGAPPAAPKFPRRQGSPPSRAAPALDKKTPPANGKQGARVDNKASEKVDRLGISFFHRLQPSLQKTVWAESSGGEEPEIEFHSHVVLGQYKASPDPKITPEKKEKRSLTKCPKNAPKPETPPTSEPPRPDTQKPQKTPQTEKQSELKSKCTGDDLPTTATAVKKDSRCTAMPAVPLPKPPARVHFQSNGRRPPSPRKKRRKKARVKARQKSVRAKRKMSPTAKAFTGVAIAYVAVFIGCLAFFGGKMFMDATKTSTSKPKSKEAPRVKSPSSSRNSTDSCHESDSESDLDSDISSDDSSYNDR